MQTSLLRRVVHSMMIGFAKTIIEDVIGVAFLLAGILEPWVRGHKEPIWSAIANATLVVSICLVYFVIRAIVVVWKEINQHSAVREVESSIYLPDQRRSRSLVREEPPRHFKAKLTLIGAIFIILVAFGLIGVRNMAARYRDTAMSEAAPLRHTNIIIETPQSIIGDPYWPLKPGKFDIRFVWRNGDQDEAKVIQDGIAVKLVRGFKGTPSDDALVIGVHNNHLGLYEHTGGSYTMNRGELHNTIVWLNDLKTEEINGILVQRTAAICIYADFIWRDSSGCYITFSATCLRPQDGNQFDWIWYIRDERPASRAECGVHPLIPDNK